MQNLSVDEGAGGSTVTGRGYYIATYTSRKDRRRIAEAAAAQRKGNAVMNGTSNWVQDFKAWEEKRSTLAGGANEGATGPGSDSGSSGKSTESLGSCAQPAGAGQAVASGSSQQARSSTLFGVMPGSPHKVSPPNNGKSYPIFRFCQTIDSGTLFLVGLGNGSPGTSTNINMKTPLPGRGA